MSRKRYIRIPEPVQVFDEQDELILENGKPLIFTFPSFIRGRTTDNSFGKNMDYIESALSIRSSIKGKSTGAIWEIDEDDWEKLVEVTKVPSAPYNPRIVIFLVPFMRAITEAKPEKPTIANTSIQSS